MTDEHVIERQDIDETDAEDSEPAPAIAPRQGDPVVTLLLTVALALIAVLLATGTLVFVYLNTLNEAPRTSIERDLAVWETAVKERPADVNSWANLAYAYAEAGRIDDALETIARAEKVTGRSQFVIVEADVLRLGGRFAEAVRAYGEAEKAVLDLQRQAEIEREKVGVKLPADDASLARVYYGRALARQELGDVKNAIADIEKAVELQPRSATMWVSLGDLYTRSEETSEAEAAYRTALKFVPDDSGALEGLERLEGGR